MVILWYKCIMTTKKSTNSTDASNVPIILALLSLLFGLVPYVGLALATAGTAIGIRSMRKVEKTKEGNIYLSWTPWSKVPGAVKVGTIISIISVFIGCIVTVFGTFFLIAFITNADKIQL